MRVLIQRAARASVRFPDRPDLGERRIGRGLVVLVGCGPGDDAAAARRLAEKCSGLRVFPDAGGKPSLSLADVAGEALVVSQFTLYGDCRKGRRPDFTGALAAAQAEPLYREFAAALAASGVPVSTGEFGARMELELVNEGPFTLWLDGAAL